MTSLTYIGHVYHKRHTPFEHHFRYKVYSLYLDLDDLETPNKWRFLSYNRFNIFSISDYSHAQRDGTKIKSWIHNIAQSKNIDLIGGKIKMLTFPRILGWAFTPITIYFCYNAETKLVAILYQVKNTFGQQHSYFIPVLPDHLKSGGWIEQQCDKIFYVSPFIQMDCIYKFRLKEPSDHLDIAIHQFQPGGKILTATWDGAAQPLTDATILKAFISVPMQMVKIIAGIHWEALKLWIKGAKFIQRPAPPSQDVT